MVGSQPTLLDILQPQQFRLVALLAMGLEHANIAYFLEVSEPAVDAMLDEILQSTNCPSSTNLAIRLLFESNNDLFDRTRLNAELAEVKKRASELLQGLPSSTGTYLEP